MNLITNRAYKVYSEVPVVCALVNLNGKSIITENYVERNKCPIHHAEILAIQQACKKWKCKFLDQCTIYVTLEPCKMCEEAIYISRIFRVVFGAFSNQQFTNQKYTNSYNIIGGVYEKKNSTLLTKFFSKLRNTEV